MNLKPEQIPSEAWEVAANTFDSFGLFASDEEVFRAVLAAALPVLLGEPVAFSVRSADGELSTLGFIPMDHFDETKRGAVLCEGWHYVFAYHVAETTLPAQDTPMSENCEMLMWAVGQWNLQVCHRPLENVHRRSLDDVWRQVIRKCGGDDIVMCGPRHDQLLSMSKDTPMPTNKPEVVLPELPEPIGHVHSDYEYCAGRPFKNDGWPVSVYDAGQMRAYGQACIDTLTRPADGEFHECPHCKGWSRTSAQQPAEAVAVDLERFRPMVDKYRVDWAAYVQTMQKAGRSAIDGKKKVDEACELLAIIDSAPPAIDIGKLRELVSEWRSEARDIRDRGMACNYNSIFARADQLAALIGDGGENGNGKE